MNNSINTENRTPTNTSQMLTAGEQSFSFPRDHHNIIDLLRTWPSSISFAEQVRKIGLSPDLEKKVIRKSTSYNRGNSIGSYLTEQDEKELASEVLMLRHAFTCLVFQNRFFRQAALTIIQNIYLFRQRKIFFGTLSDEQGEAERQMALLLFSSSPEKTTVGLANTFQHLIIARVWDRIINQSSNSFLQSSPFAELHDIVERLNTLRNIYILLSMGLLNKLASQVNGVYRQSITEEDARQIGSFGVARAAYRYHPSLGLRFSTYASRWIHKEIQRQALEGRLIRISSHLIEKFSRAVRDDSEIERDAIAAELRRATAMFNTDESEDGRAPYINKSGGLEHILEKEQMNGLLLRAIDTLLSPKSSDVIKRRFGLGEYNGREQSVVAIASVYGVTRSSIYQLEKSALEKLRLYFATFNMAEEK